MQDRNLALGTDGGGCYVLEACGRQWVFCQLTQADKAEFERWARSQLVTQLRTLRAELPTEEYRAVEEAALSQLATGAYSWTILGLGSELERQLRRADGQGAAKLLELCLRAKQPWITQDDLATLAAAAPEEVRVALTECLKVPNSTSPGGSQNPGTASR